jgi:HEAT repeat protein
MVEYVYLLPLTDVAEMARQLGERGGAVDEETLAAVRALLPRLDSNDPAVRDEASQALEALPREAVLAIVELLKEGGLSAEVSARLTDAAATLFRKPGR